MYLCTRLVPLLSLAKYTIVYSMRIHIIIRSGLLLHAHCPFVWQLRIMLLSSKIVLRRHYVLCGPALTDQTFSLT